MSQVGWPTYAYGITTVPSRRHTTLPRTLRSLSAGGFPSPRLFVDVPPREKADYESINLDITFRYPALGLHGNWILSLYELYLRDPLVNRYVLFQDDVICYKNLRQYLNRQKLKDDMIWNLYTHAPDRQITPPDPEPPGAILKQPEAGWCGPEGAGWFPSDQLGKGALALVFPREAVKRILAHPHIITKAQDHKRRNTIDGAISEVIRNLKIIEYCHDPSLVNHIGDESTIGHHYKTNRGYESIYLPCRTFRGESFDAMELL